MQEPVRTHQRTKAGARWHSTRPSKILVAIHVSTHITNVRLGGNLGCMRSVSRRPFAVRPCTRAIDWAEVGVGTVKRQGGHDTPSIGVSHVVDGR